MLLIHSTIGVQIALPNNSNTPGMTRIPIMAKNNKSKIAMV